MQKTPRAVAMGLSLASLGMLTLQLSLTRVFSLLVWYHFAFLAIALALLGFTAGGVIVQRRPELLDAASFRDRIARLAFACAASTVLALLVAAHLPFGSSVLADAGQVSLFVILVGALTVPFVLAGVIVSATLAAHPHVVARLYFADLVGSGVGCVVALVAMDHLGGGAGGVLVAAAAFAASGIAFADPRSPRLRATGIAALLVASALALLARAPLRDPFYLPNAKLYPRVPREFVLSRHCTSLACVDFFQNPLHFGLWGMSSRYKGPKPEQIGVVIDAWAITSIVQGKPQPDGTLAGEPALEALPPAVVHHFLRATHRPSPEELVIGAGGGIDVRTALMFGAKHVDAVDINPTIVKAVAGEFDAFAGGLYHRPDVSVSVAEGRHFLRRANRRWDLVQISGVDTYAASQAGAFALTENYLYTVEAMREYVAHLADDGILSLTRWLYKPPRQTLRLVAIADRALREAGIGDAASRMVVVAAPVPDSDIDFSVVLVRKTPFTAAEIDALQKIAALMAYKIVWAPGVPLDNAFSRYFAAPDKDAFFRDYPYRVEPTTDDKPFFFEHNRFSRLLSSSDSIFGVASGQVVLVATLLLVCALAAVVLFGARGARLPAPQATYFVALGLAYVALELALVPRFTLFLGHPSHALSVVLLSMLCASGVGSALSSRVRSVVPIGVAIAIVVAVYAFALPRLLDAALHWPFFARAALAVLLVALPATLMGMPFPLGLRDRDAAFVARAWVINGAASVIASVGAMIIAIAAGFRLVTLIAAALYLLVALLGRTTAASA